MDQVTVHAPATVSNVVCGFDCMGFALDAPYDVMTVRLAAETGIRIVHHDKYGLPTDPDANIAGVALAALVSASGVSHGFEIEITKNIKPGSGIGSSAASACGVVVAADRLLGSRFTTVDLIDFAMAGEMLASGSRHADNLAPCIMGGFVLVRSSDPLDVVDLKHPPLFATVIHPQIEVKTSEARAILPREVPLGTAVRNWSNLGAFVAGLTSGDLDLMSRSMVDEIVEPARQGLIPGFDELRNAAMGTGAIGCGISGAGPSVFALSSTMERAEAIATSMAEAYSPLAIDFNIHTSGISHSGVRIV